MMEVKVDFDENNSSV